MADQKWSRINVLFYELLDAPEEDRHRLFDEVCAGADEPTRQELLALRCCHEVAEAEGFLEPKQPIPGLASVEKDDDSLIGSEFGVYVAETLLGRGGMGDVYRAVRREGYDQQVAVKVLRSGWRDPLFQKHFHREVQAQALQDHPSIVRVIDAGKTKDARPYLIMDYVDGERIDNYCDSHELTIPERLRLFLDVCSAVEHCHQGAVLHRDIKPSNILVTKNGTPKLLDFGIAKLIDADEHGAFSGLTAGGSRFFTWEYASPEQINGLPLTVASDVYSLGVLLYELLSGCRPFDLTGMTDWEKAQIVSRQECTIPSRAASLGSAPGSGEGHAREAEIARLRGCSIRSLRHKLSKDLDSIVMKALRKDPRRRYLTVEQFAADIRRHLMNEPVHAHSGKLLYRISKFVRRRHLELGVVTLLLLTAAVFSYLLVASRGRFERERDKAEAVVKLLLDIFDASDPRKSPGGTSLREVVDSAAARVAVDLQKEPKVAALYLHTLGSIYVSLGVYDKAEELLRKSIELRKGESGPVSVEVAESMEKLGIAYLDQNKYEEAEALFREVLHIREESLGKSDPSVATVLLHLGWVDGSLARYEEAERDFQRSLAIRKAVFGERSAEAAEVIRRLAVTLRWDGEYQRSESLLERAVRDTADAKGPNHPDVAEILGELAGVYRDEGKVQEARLLLQRSLGMREAVFGTEHKEVAFALNDLAVLELSDGKPAVAEQFYRHSLRILEKVFGREHSIVAVVLNNLAAACREQGKLGEAESLLKESIAIDRRIFGADHPDTGGGLGVLGLLLEDLDRSTEAEAVFKEAIRIFTKSGHKSLQALNMRRLGLLYLALRKYSDAERLLNGAFELNGEEGRENPLDLRALGELRLARGELQEARELFERGLAKAEALYGKTHPHVSALLKNLAGVCLQLDDQRASESWIKRALKIDEDALGPDDPGLVPTLNLYAEILRKGGSGKAAESMSKRARSLRSRLSKGP